MSTTDSIVVRQGEAACVRLAVRDTLRIEQTTGGQCADLLAWGGDVDGGERLSPAITRSREGASPSAGASLWSAWPFERPLLEITADTAPGHDLLHPACTPGEYERLGVRGEPSCAGVHAAAAAACGLGQAQLTDPFNLWFRATLSADGEIGWLPTRTNAGDHLELRACVDCLVVVNPCVDDMFGCSTTPGGSIRVTHRSAVAATSRISVAGAPVAAGRLVLRLDSAEAAILDAKHSETDRAQAIRLGAVRHALRATAHGSAKA